MLRRLGAASARSGNGAVWHLHCSGPGRPSESPSRCPVHCRTASRPFLSRLLCWIGRRGTRQSKTNDDDKNAYKQHAVFPFFLSFFSSPVLTRCLTESAWNSCVQVCVCAHAVAGENERGKGSKKRREGNSSQCRSTLLCLSLFEQPLAAMRTQRHWCVKHMHAMCGKRRD